METVLAVKLVGLSALKANPGAVMRAAEDEPVAILNRNKPAGYIIGAAQSEAFTELLENPELAQVANARLADGQQPAHVRPDEL